MGTSRRPLTRGLALAFKAAPGPIAGSLAIQALVGFTPAVIALSTSRIIDGVGGGGGSVVLPVLAAAVVVMAAEALDSLQAVLIAAAKTRVTNDVSVRTLEAVAGTPGLAAVEDSAFADRLSHADGAGSELPQLVSLSSYALRWSVQALSGLALAGAVGAWVPLALLATTSLAAVAKWTEEARAAEAHRRHTIGSRKARYHLSLPPDPAVARELRIFGLGDWLLGRQQQFWSEHAGEVLRERRRSIYVNLVFGVVRGLVVVVAVVGALGALSSGSIEVSDFTAAVMGLLAAVSALSFVVTFAGQFGRYGRFLPELFEVLALPETQPGIREKPAAAAPPVTAPPIIRFEGVVFRYPGATAPVLRGVDLELAAGRCTAIVGENGAGKSTLVKLLCRLYDPDEGRITIDGLDIRDLDVNAWRRLLAVVFQDPIRLPLSARENVEAGAATVNRDLGADSAAAVAEAGADVTMAGLPNGWDTILDPRFGGVELSEGQWQRIALARALLARRAGEARVLVLDEPTAALDVRLEHELYERFAEVSAGFTTLLVSHRFSTVRVADAVAVLDGGRVVEQGDHHSLIAAKGRYAELFGLQAQRFGPTR